VQTERPLQYAETLTAHDHAVAFYETPEQKWRLVANHLKLNLNDATPAFYVSYFEDADRVRGSLRERGIDIDRQRANGRFKILEFGEHVKNQRFDRMALELKGVCDQFSGGGGTDPGSRRFNLNNQEGFR
jgi:hypothetical protein